MVKSPILNTFGVKLSNHYMTIQMRDYTSIYIYYRLNVVTKIHFRTTTFYSNKVLGVKYGLWEGITRIKAAIVRFIGLFLEVSLTHRQQKREK